MMQLAKPGVIFYTLDQWESTIWAVNGDWNGGVWGAFRHALTVGFVSTMIFAIGQRILPAFCGMRIFFSKGLMFGVPLRVNCSCVTQKQ